jgi:DNA-binding MltR family transcriptional regulator
MTEPKSPVSSKSNAESAIKDLLAMTPSRDKNQARVDVLVGVGSVDVALQSLLTKYLTQSMDEQDDLLSEGKPLGSLMLRAKLALRLGLISPDLYAIIKSLSRIRNISAHSEQRFDPFEEQGIKQNIQNIWLRLDKEYTKRADTSTEMRFNEICSLVEAMIIFGSRTIKPASMRNQEPIFEEAL